MYSRLQYDGRSLSWNGPKREAVNAGYGVQDNQWLHRIQAAQGPVEGKSRKYGTARGGKVGRQKQIGLTEMMSDWGSSPRWVSVL